MDTVHNLVIIGSGPAGLTAAIYAARGHLAPLLIQGNEPGGQLMGTSFVENWPGEKSILGPQLMMRMQDQVVALGVTVMSTLVKQVDFKKRPFSIETEDKKLIHAHAIIIATGASPLRLNCPGESDYWGKGISSCAVCDGTFYENKPIIIIGGGDTAMEDASFMRKFTNKITIIHILDKLTACASLQQRVVNDPAITLMYESTVTAFHGNVSHLTGVTITNQKTKKTSDLEVQGAFIAIGYKPNTGLFKEYLNLDKHGYIQVEKNSSTSVPGIFAAGDVHDFRYRQAITSAGSGCMAALDAERYLKEVGII